ncbi:hypothetical protein [Pseudalkalibacillus caeni]|nr:hypothetical protein [Pseudalkalibacillus caeni]
MTKWLMIGITLITISTNSVFLPSVTLSDHSVRLAQDEDLPWCH